MKDRIQLGYSVKDTVSGLKGIATGRNEFLNGCVRFLIEPPVDKSGKPVEGLWVDEQQIQIVRKDTPVRKLLAKTAEAAAEKEAAPGGPRDVPDPAARP